MSVGAGEPLFETSGLATPLPPPLRPGTAGDKVMDIEQLARVTAAHRDRGEKVVHCHGCFDLLHIGHIRHLRQARKLGQVLVVTITPDHYVDKGPGRPAFPQELRAEALAALDCVDYVAINRWPTAEKTLRLLRPHYFVKGSEFKDTGSDRTGKIGREERVVREIGAELAFTEDIVFSSSNLINRYFSNQPAEVNQFLERYRQSFPLPDNLELLDRMGRLKVLVIGDTILDEYQYCETIGRSSKDPVLALKYKGHELQAGGVLAVANHLADFAGEVELVTVLGGAESQEEFIRSRLHPRVRPRFFYQPDAPTLIKRRFLDEYTLGKLLEVYVYDCRPLREQVATDICRHLHRAMAACDLVVASDFGHGAISPEMVLTLCRHAPFLAVNTQANAGNRGFHTISRYPRGDFVCLAEHELRLEMRSAAGPVEPMLHQVAGRLDCERMVVTRGSKGCLVREGAGGVSRVPAFSQKIVDRVGAGDAFFSVTALAARLGAAPEQIGFLGNVAGSLAVEVLGNQRSVSRLAFEKYLTAALK